MKDKKKFYEGPRMVGEEQERINLRIRREHRAQKNAAGRNTNEVFAATDSEFKQACEAAGIKPTARQASKWHRRTGLAYTKKFLGGQP